VLASESAAACVPSALQQDAFCLMLASNDTALDEQLPPPASLLGGGERLPVFLLLVSLRRLGVLCSCRQQLQLGSAFAPAPSLPGAVTGPSGDMGIRLTTQLRTVSCGASFFAKANSSGIVLWEPCGGLCAGLEMVLRNGFSVQQYYYFDTDVVAQTVAIDRVIQLQEQYPRQLQQRALSGCFSAMPADITAITVQHLYAAFQRHPDAQWLVVAGWPCQDFSSARSFSWSECRTFTVALRLGQADWNSATVLA